MRIEGWHVEGFGVWHDADVADLGPGITVFLGENEAGKTTLLAFLRAMLFGFADGRTRENPYPPLAGGRHGGRILLRDEGGVWTVSRYAERRKAVEIIRPDGGPGDETDLRRLLSGVDAKLFTSVFAFSLAELQQFATLDAESIRERIFSVGISGAGQSARAVLKEFADHESRLLKQRAGKAQINDLVRDLQQAEEELRRAEEEARRYPDLRAAEDQEAVRIEALDDELAALTAARRRYETFVALRPDWDALVGTEDELATLPTPSDPGTADAVADLVARLRVLASKEAGLAELRAEQLAGAGDLKALLVRLGPGWTRERVATTDDSLAVHDAVRGWQQELRQKATGVEQAEREEQAARETLAEVDAEHRRCRRDLPAEEPPELDAITTRDIALRSLRGRLGDLEAAELQARPDGGGSRRLGRLLAVAALLVLATAVVAAVAGASQLGIGLAVGAGVLAVVAGVTLLGPGDGAAHRREADERLAGLRAEVAAAARPLGLNERPAQADLNELEALLARDRDGRVTYDGAQAKLRLVETRLASQNDKVEVLAGKAKAAREAAAEADSAWGDWLAERDLPHLSPEGALETLDTVRRAREADAAQIKATQAIAAVESERAQWSAEAETALRAAGLDRSQARPAALEAALTDLDGALTRRAELIKRREECEQRLAVGLASFDDPEASRRELAEGDKDAWRRKIELLAAEREDVDARRTAAIEARRDARRAREDLEVSADVPTRQNELESLRADLAAAAHEYRVVTTAGGLVRETLRSYVRDRQPGVLARASAAFATATNGRFRAVVQEAGETSDAILVEQWDGATLSPDKLSRGTCEQLYLAIRLALAGDFAARGQALPLIMDDCLVNFDPRRAGAMAGLIAELAGDGQCLFFTCHPATADQLRAAGPEVRLVALPGRMPDSADEAKPLSPR